MEKLRKSIRRTLRQRDMSLEALAEEVGVGRSTLFELMNPDANLPRLSTLAKLRKGGVRIPRNLFD